MILITVLISMPPFQTRGEVSETRKTLPKITQLISGRNRSELQQSGTGTL